MSDKRSAIGPVLYGILFVLLLPLGLVLWARGAASAVSLPTVESIPLGVGCIVAGAGLILSGMLMIVIHGRGLPMNAYPPQRYVLRGPYRIIRHPIYLGFVLLCAGGSLVAGSAAGLWLVTPIAILGSVALVLGYEGPDLRKRFGDPLPETYLRIPPAAEARPSFRDWLSVQFLVLLPWAVLYEWLLALGASGVRFIPYFPFERDLPVMEWTEVLYASTYLIVFLAPAFAATQRDLRMFAIRGIVATVLMPLFFVAIPFAAPPRPFIPGGWAGEVLLFERSLDTAGNAFPSYHVIWVLLAISLVARKFPRGGWLWWGIGTAVALSCVTTGMHAIVDVVAGALLVLALMKMEGIWNGLREWAERQANSWKEWRRGRIRVINHGLYAGIGSFCAVAIAGSLAREGGLLPVLLVALSALIVSALWAQVIEGSPALLRPYGYYGGVVGIIFGALLAWPVFGSDPWLLLAAFSVGGPWVQSLGRIRCLIQGCCHGSRAPEGIGIVYRHPRSRVTRLSDLGGTPLHPTPLYSILWNVVIAAIVTRIWIGGAPLSMVSGLYLILTGVGRFVEEGYRGEPQTRMVAGLRFYQWVACVTVAGGAVVTTMPSAPAPSIGLPGPEVIGGALLFGGATWFALGVDFPDSKRRFARLT